MRLQTLHRRSLRHYWRAHLAVVLGVVAGTAALTGALLVGDSMRGSLREAALDRLGTIDYALTAPRFFREALADELADPPTRMCSVILARGGCTHAESRATVQRVNVIGVNERFWELSDVRSESRVMSPAGLVILNETLARELRAAPGDDVLLRLGKPSAVSTESLLGRRDDTTLTLRLAVRSVIPAENLGAFSLSPRQTVPRNAYVPLATLQRAFGRPGRVNALLADAPDEDVNSLSRLLSQRLSLDDLGLRLRMDDAHDYVAIESEAFLLEPALEQVAHSAATATDTPTTAVLAYLANTIAVDSRPDAVIPYSTVAAVEPADTILQYLIPREDGATATLLSGKILLNEWAARDLQATPGDRIQLSYYVPGTLGELHTEETTFRLAGIVRMQGAAADPGFTPEYPGVTDTDSLADWDPPFPIDLKKIRDKDEAYWRQYRTTPKAFVSLADGQRLWATQPQLGRLTSLRVRLQPGATLETTRAEFERAFLSNLDPAQVGLGFDPVRQRALAASEGTTDFGGLFIGFSFFLIISAAMLVALLFRLGVERRSSEVGLLLALGFSPQRVARLLLAEGILLAGIAAGVGLLVARGYAWLMLAGLRSWWVGAVNAPFLRLHDSATSYVIGYGVSLLVAAGSIAWSLRGLTGRPAHALLAGVIQSGRPTARRRRGIITAIVALVALGLTGVLSTLTFVTDAVSQSVTFFLGGTALLIACIAGLTYWLRIEPRSAVRTAGLVALWRLGVRNARRRVGRSVLTAGLIAAATFVIAALQAMRLDAPAETLTKDSGTGGFALLAESAVPLPYDLNTSAGRAELNLTETAESTLAAAGFIPFRLREGDETSCLNLYRPTQPRVLGATPAMIERGGFAFSNTLAESEGERRNPWTLLRREHSDGSIPIIADEGAVLWQLHSKLGGELTITDERGREARLRIVAMLKGSILQGELIVAEEHFTWLFPSITGHGFFLIDAPAQAARQLEETLERELVDFGLAARSTRGRLNELFVVQNTYLSTFQTLGGLGLLLGTIGLAAVLLRNIWERRSELALMQALGFSRAALVWLVLSENAVLVAAGLGAGLLSAGLAIAPHAASRAELIPW
ncbi:MAG: FtsX-like permease family protein, partial [Planctomycetes bacterium]|nr:FtsX-like permease family protein [Planctomycetota bacterium]